MVRQPPFDSALFPSYAEYMKIVIADKISERGITLLRDAKWDVVVSSAATLHQDLQDADGLIVRSATKVTAGLLEKAPKLPGGGPRRRRNRQHRRRRHYSPRRFGDERSRWQIRRRRRTHRALMLAMSRSVPRLGALDSRRALGKGRRRWYRAARKDARIGRFGTHRRGGGTSRARV